MGARRQNGLLYDARKGAVGQTELYEQLFFNIVFIRAFADDKISIGVITEIIICRDRTRHLITGFLKYTDFAVIISSGNQLFNKIQRIVGAGYQAVVAGVVEIFINLVEYKRAGGLCIFF
ncbi:MAG: hypothetical protein R3183_14685 [Oleiphilaceae bacterium]|nr:hypothetical protein [Oleiphilaceae bacterium]